ncbi:hypothetical protein EC991_006720 [Linnemannia zychae]|nr:hypothetical protein EC991_006720 [Linnemannia zychae]
MYQTMGISPTLLDVMIPSDVLEEGIICTLDGDQQVRSIFASQSCIITGNPEMLDTAGVENVLEMVLRIVISFQSSFSASELHLTSSGAQLSNMLRTTKGDQIDLVKVGQLHDSMKQLLQSIPVAPEHFLSRLLWTTAVCLEACKDIAKAHDASLPCQDKEQQQLSTTSMKI